MINREWQTVNLLTYSTTVDEYGQFRTNTPTSKDIEMVVKIFAQTEVDNPKYVNIEKIGITKEKNISTENEIKIDNQLYVVRFIIPSGKYYQILMEKK